MKLIRASDARSWILCPRRAWYDNNRPSEFTRLDPEEFDLLLQERGLEHERKIKEELEKHYQVVEAFSEEQTRQLMAAGVEVIYQPRFTDATLGIIGTPDFLIKHQSGYYQPADAKLATGIEEDEKKKEKKAIRIQLEIYRRLLKSSAPAIVFMGDGSKQEIASDNQPAEEFIYGMRDILDSTVPPPATYGETKCNACTYSVICKKEFIENEELTLLYDISAPAARSLRSIGINTISDLANADAASIFKIPQFPKIEKCHRAVQQAKIYFTGDYHQIAPIRLPEGTWIHFDVESYPWANRGADYVYLWGFLKPPYNATDFDYVWIDSENDDLKGWEQFLNKLSDFKGMFPDLILAHFSPFEKSQIESYAEHYQTLGHPIVQWLLGDQSPLFDMKTSVKDSLVLPLAGYGLKQICKHPKLVNFKWQDEDSGSQWSVVQFYRYLAEASTDKRKTLKQDILKYNFDDVLASRKLEEWLRSLS